MDTEPESSSTATLPSETLTIENVYRRAGFDVRVSSNGGSVPLSLSGADGVWSRVDDACVDREKPDGRYRHVVVDEGDVGVESMDLHEVSRESAWPLTRERQPERECGRRPRDALGGAPLVRPETRASAAWECGGASVRTSCESQ